MFRNLNSISIIKLNQIYRTYGANMFGFALSPMATALRRPWATDMTHLWCSHYLSKLAFSLYSSHRGQKCHPQAGWNGRQNNPVNEIGYAGKFMS